jgi:hypothetical protein
MFRSKIPSSLASSNLERATAGWAVALWDSKLRRQRKSWQQKVAGVVLESARIINRLSKKERGNLSRQSVGQVLRGQPQPQPNLNPSSSPS